MGDSRPRGPATLRGVGASSPLAKIVPGLVAAVFALPILVVGQHLGFVADVPLVILAVGVIGGALLAIGATLLLPPGGSDRAMSVRLLLCFSSVGFILYLTGWGAVLAIGYVFGAIEEFRVSGSRVARRAIPIIVAVTVAGESAVEVGWFKTFISKPQGHGLAFLTVLGAVLIIGFLGIAHAEKEKFAGDLRYSEERLGALVRYASDAIVVIDNLRNVKYASPAIERVLGYPPDELGNLGRMVHVEHVEDARSLFDEVLAHPNDVSWIDVRMQHKNGEWRWFEIGVTNMLDDPAVEGLVCNMRDITDRRNAEEQLTFQAHHDALTRLPNRWYFLEQLERVQQESAVDGRCVGVFFLDIDRFKIVNDSLGHDVGDQLLVLIADRLATCLRPGDVVARFGGDEFTVLLDDLSDPDLALRVAERIIESMRQPVTVEGHELFVSASIGVALSRGGEHPASELLRFADLAMYVAKEKGRARWEVFDPSLMPHVMERLELEGDLYRALEHGELNVQFQPEVALDTGRVRAAEALVRWQHPRRGLLEPDSFVPFAEESSLIVAIDRFVLRNACQWARRWSTIRANDGTPFVVSVNLSPRFMRQADMVVDVTSVLRETGVDPRCIQIEITERSALTDLETTCAQLHQLRSIGVRVAVDDFGTGYSSLSYLKRLPIDVLKLNKSFVDGLDAGPADVAIVQAIVTMGHALGVKVTAEGVERPEQVARLRDLGCDTAMGWLWSAAVPPEELAAVAEGGFDLGRDAVVVPVRARG